MAGRDGGLGGMTEVSFKVHLCRNGVSLEKAVHVAVGYAVSRSVCDTDVLRSLF